MYIQFCSENCHIATVQGDGVKTHLLVMINIATNPNTPFPLQGRGVKNKPTVVPFLFTATLTERLGRQADN